MVDFEITVINSSGEIGISAVSEGAQKFQKLLPGHSVVFKTSIDAAEYVEQLESHGFSLTGKENLRLVAGNMP